MFDFNSTNKTKQNTKRMRRQCVNSTSFHKTSAHAYCIVRDQEYYCDHAKSTDDRRKVALVVCFSFLFFSFLFSPKLLALCPASNTDPKLCMRTRSICTPIFMGHMLTIASINPKFWLGHMDPASRYKQEI